MKISEKFKVREMAGEHVIIMPGRVGADMTRILALNDSSLYLWETLRGRDFTTEEAAGLLTERYEVDEATALRDAQAGHKEPLAVRAFGSRIKFLHETEKTHIAVAALRLPAGDGRTCVCVAFMQVRRDEGPCRARMLSSLPARCGYFRRNRVAEGHLLRQSPFDGNQSLYILAGQRKIDPLYGYRPAARAGGRGSGACRHLARRGENRRTLRPLRRTGPCPLRGTPRPSRIGLKPFWGGCCVHPSGISFNQ